MPAGVGVLRPERRSKRVDPAQSQTIGLDVELSGNSKKSLAAEEVTREVRSTIGVPRQVCEVECADAEQLSRSLGVGSRDDRSVDPQVAVGVEELVDRLRQAVPDARDRSERIGPRPQMGDFPEKLEAVALRGNRVRVRVVDPALDCNLSRTNLHALTASQRFDQFALDRNSATAAKVQDFSRIVRKRTIRHDL